MYISQNTKSEGDDLIAAQVFVSSAKPHMEVLSSVSRLDHNKAEGAILALKSGAGLISARAIFRACDQTLNLIGDSASQPIIDSGLMTLRKLVSQYSDGLDEVLMAEETQAQLDSPVEAAPNLGVVTEDNTDDITTLKQPEQPKQMSGALAADHGHQIAAVPAAHVPLSSSDLEILSKANARAAATLDPLLKFVKSAGHKLALQNIMRPIATARPDIDETHPSFEVIMPSVINSILADARQLGKNVSVSYLVGDTHIPNAQMDKIETCTKELGRCLVKYSLEAPDERLSRGESLTGQISVTAQANTVGMEIVISCTGTELPEIVKDRIEKGSSAFEISYAYKESRSTLSLYVAQSVLESKGNDRDEIVSKAPRLPLSREVRHMQELSL